MMLLSSLDADSLETYKQIKFKYFMLVVLKTHVMKYHKCEKYKYLEITFKVLLSHVLT